MSTSKKTSRSSGSPDEKLVHARITTATTSQMLELLKGRPLEVIARGPRRLKDGSFVINVVAPRRELEKLPKGDWTVEVLELPVVKDPEKEVSKGNRYAKEGAVPRGVGIKK